MRYISTRGCPDDDGKARTFSFEESLLSGYAPDGGMILPERLPSVSRATLRSWAGLSYAELAIRVLRLFISDSEVPDMALREAVESTVARFAVDETTPITSLPSGRDATLHVMELWHGPTLAFKDLGLGILGRLMNYFLSRRDRHATVVVGTSGDTGSAAIHAVLGLPQVDIVVLYPHGRVSQVQEAQMVSVDDDHVHVLGTDGTSDDLDVPIRRVFLDVDYCNRHGVCSANSINVCRIIVQTIHFFYAYLKLRPRCDGYVSFSIPTGAAGHLTSAVMAKQCGLPIGTIVAATNTNDILHRAFTSGDFTLGDGVIPTSAPSMDIQVPYNIERILYYACGGDVTRVKAWMEQFEARGRLKLKPEIVSAFPRMFGLVSTAVQSDAIDETIRRVWREHGYIMCPHTAVGVAARYSNAAVAEGAEPVVCMATAHAAKFHEATEAALPATLPPYHVHREIARSGGEAASKLRAALHGGNFSEFVPRCGCATSSRCASTAAGPGVSRGDATVTAAGSAGCGCQCAAMTGTGAGAGAGAGADGSSAGAASASTGSGCGACSGDGTCACGCSWEDAWTAKLRAVIDGITETRAKQTKGRSRL